MSNRKSNRPASNLDTGPKEPAQVAELEAFASDDSAVPEVMKVETQFEIVDNTEAEAEPEREAESSERQLDNGMMVVDYV